MSIKMTFHKGGFVTIEPTGYSGSTCHDATRPYTDAFGGEQDVKETEEENVTAPVTNQQSVKAGG